MTKKLTIGERVGKLRLQGLSNMIVAERLGISRNSANVHWYHFRNKQKQKAYAKKYYEENKEKINKYQVQWQRDNPDLMEEYRYRRKCKEAGVQPSA